jgi:hypothetical protein
MVSEKERLLKLLNTNKISQEDYTVLSDALEGKASKLTRYFSLLVNPFQKVAGLEAMAIGLTLLLVMSWLALQSQVHFPGLFDLQLNKVDGSKSVKLSYLIILYQNVVSVSLLAMSYFLSAKFYKVRGLRFQDFLGTVLLSRYPYFIATFVFYLLFNHLGLTFSVENIDPGITAIVSIVAIVALVWQSLTYFFSFKESSGLSGKSLWKPFLLTMVSVEILSAFLTRIFF